MNQKVQYRHPFSIHFWKAYVLHMRPYLLFVSGVVGWAGISLASTDHTTSYIQVAAFIPLFLGYGFGQALTDCFQLDTDRISAPYRPLSQGIIGIKQVAIVSITGLIMISLILVFLNWWNLLLCFFSIIGLASYSKVKRNLWFAGPFYNAWIVALLPIMGFISISKDNLFSLELSNLLYLIGLSFFSYSSFVLMGYLKDIGADRSSGYETLPVKFGWNAAVWVSDIFVLVSILLCCLSVSKSNFSLLLFIFASTMAITGQVYAHITKSKVESNAIFPIASTVRSMILWHLALIQTFKPDSWALILIFYLSFEISLYFRPERVQI